MTFILIIWLLDSNGNAPPVVVERFGTLISCEAAGAEWERVMSSRNYAHHACLPHN